MRDEKWNNFITLLGKQIILVRISRVFSFASPAKSDGYRAQILAERIPVPQKRGRYWGGQKEDRDGIGELQDHKKTCIWPASRLELCILEL